MGTAVLHSVTGYLFKRIRNWMLTALKSKNSSDKSYLHCNKCDVGSLNALGNDHLLWHNVRTWKATKSFSCGCNWKPTWRGAELQSYLNGSINHSSHIKGHRKMAVKNARDWNCRHIISHHQYPSVVLIHDVPVLAPSSKKSPLTFPSQVPVLRNGSAWRDSRIWDLVSKCCLLQSVLCCRFASESRHHVWFASATTSHHSQWRGPSFGNYLCSSRR